jgi:outer membrane protein OmpA-like peptidoglycan-associated protein
VDSRCCFFTFPLVQEIFARLNLSIRRKPSSRFRRMRLFQKVDLRGVEFQHDGSIKSASDPVLDSALDMLKDKPGATIYVDAYCDPSGGEKLNERLSKERAAAVSSYLVKHGIPADHIVARGLGATNFVASNATHSGREQNRRIELVVRPRAAS